MADCKTGTHTGRQGIALAEIFFACFGKRCQAPQANRVGKKKKEKKKGAKFGESINPATAGTIAPMISCGLEGYGGCWERSVRGDDGEPCMLQASA